MIHTHRSKVDGWLAALLLSSAAASLWAGFEVLRSHEPGATWLAAVVVLLGTGLPIWLLASTRYDVDGTHLRIACGPLRTRIALADITRVTPSRSLLSSPALSLDRLLIEYGDGRTVLISPRDPARFRRDIGHG